MKEIKLNNKIISDKSPIFFIAEIGINHNGSLEIAKKMIDLAYLCEADCVKFQKRTPELCVPEEQKNILKETPWGQMTYFEYKKRIEFEKEEYDEIDKYCKERNIIWTASPWDIPSVEFLEQYDVPFYKLPSAMLTNKELLTKIKELKKPIMLSTGMSTEIEIEKAIKLLGEENLILLHCNSAYPAKEEELNLNYISILKEKYPNIIIGYSGHEVGFSASIVAATLGAKVIERHITLDRAMWGTDQAASLGPDGLRRLIRDLKSLPIWLGDGVKIVTDSEEKVKKKLRNINSL
ncbi:MAG: N-acetylneuraminate synthase family protein [Candidatus Woesearchaeota archaeon]